MNYTITRQNKPLKGEIIVPASKSISNRLLIIRALSGKPFEIDNLSDSEDTKVLVKVLSENSKIADIGHAGTSMRFLTAFFATTEGEKVLTGSKRMKERPIGNLVSALNKLGAEINYLEKVGFPPLIIKGKQLNGGKVSIDSSVSSQFISSLLLAAPTFKNGIELQLENKVISSSYIDLTLKLMGQMGVRVEKHKNYLEVLPQKYNPCNIKVEGDWSGVSYWYEAVVFSPGAEIFIYNLEKDSLQGDSRCAEIFKYFGLETEYKPGGIRIYNNDKLPARFDFDFIENPDLVQTMAVTCVMKKIPFCFTGTQSLRIKETDRIEALQNELKKFGAELKYQEGGILEWNGLLKDSDEKKIKISTYQDHRMALAFAPIAILGREIEIENPGVVAKSYPGYWNDLEKMGFEVK